ncbi:MAG TPA: transporter substrate-binding domain-containing protein [Acholeplasmataceae bacterium]|nr:transporter substrate-binding domain-containing protein [Acholeplasmataceae bacterium]
MKKLMYLIIFILVFVLVGCGSTDQRLEKIINKKEIVIITSPDYPPFEFIDTSKEGMDKYIGADIELMKYIANELGVTLKLEVADFNTTLASLGLGTVDLAISGYTYDSERAANYELSIPYYNEGGQGVLVLSENYDNLNSIEKLNTDLKIGAQAGSLQASYVEELLPNAKLENFVTIPDGITLLDKNIISGISMSEKVANIIINKYPNKYKFVNAFNVDVSETSMYVIAKKGEVSLINKVNEIIEKVIELDLYKKWDMEATEIAIELGLL